MTTAFEAESVNIQSLSSDEFLRVLAFFSREACSSMDEGNGLRAGLYSRRIDDALKLRQIVPIELADVDLQNSIVYPSLAD
jgi:hypothetical protein